MKEGIHPQNNESKVICTCGENFVATSTKKEIHVEVCSKCHPFYTGRQKADTVGGRVDKFNKRFNLAGK